MRAFGPSNNQGGFVSIPPEPQHAGAKTGQPKTVVITIGRRTQRFRRQIQLFQYDMGSSTPPSKEKLSRLFAARVWACTVERPLANVVRSTNAAAVGWPLLVIFVQY